MNNYYTSLQKHSDGYIGLVHNVLNNTIVYQTKQHPTQELVNLEIAEFLKTNTAPSVNELPQLQTALVNSTRLPVARCCGQ